MVLFQILVCVSMTYHVPDLKSLYFLAKLLLRVQKLKKQQKKSILNCGVRIFNALPIEIRSISDDLNTFKKELDQYLSKVPNQPAVLGFKPRSHDLYGKPSNSIIDWIRTENIQYDDPSTSYTDYECD